MGFNPQSEYYPTLMKCSDCSKEFVFTMTGSNDNGITEIMLCFTCFGMKHGIDAFKIKEIVDIINRIDTHTGLPMQFLWEIPYNDWSDSLKSNFEKAPPDCDN